MTSLSLCSVKYQEFSETCVRSRLSQKVVLSFLNKKSCMCFLTDKNRPGFCLKSNKGRKIQLIQNFIYQGKLTQRLLRVYKEVPPFRKFCREEENIDPELLSFTCLIHYSANKNNDTIAFTRCILFLRRYIHSLEFTSSCLAVACLLCFVFLINIVQSLHIRLTMPQQQPTTQHSTQTNILLSYQFANSHQEQGYILVLINR